MLTLLMAVVLAMGIVASGAAAETAKSKIVFCVNIQPQLPVEYWQSIADAYMQYFANAQGPSP